MSRSWAFSIQQSLRTASCRYHLVKSRSYSSIVPKHGKPLRILFCGSDDFSIASLRVLVDKHHVDKRCIESIDVICRKDKLGGRGMKTVREVPIKGTASKLGLPIHQIDSFKELGNPEWRQKINLIIAVSFGLLIPARLIESAEYGGLNLHPSLLPDLRGAAPIPHSILQGRSFTGVSLQTLHPSRFDHGHILAQVRASTKPHATADPRTSTTAELTSELGQIGARLLGEAIDSRLYVPPLQPLTISARELDEMTDGKGIVGAPKISKADMRVDWDEMTAAEILARLRAFGSVWDQTVYQRLLSSSSSSLHLHNVSPDTRVVYQGLKLATYGTLKTDASSLMPGMPFVLNGDARLEDREVGLKTVDGRVLQVLSCTVAGKKERAGVKEIARLLAAK